MLHVVADHGITRQRPGECFSPLALCALAFWREQYAEKAESQKEIARDCPFTIK